MNKNAEKPQNHSQKVSARLYVPHAQPGKEITLTHEQVRHLKVLRLSEGEKIRIFNGTGAEFEVSYSEKVRNGRVVLDKTVQGRPEPTVKITLAIAVPKGARMDTLVEKVSELGVVSIVPIICSRSIVNPHEAKIERLRKIAIEASCQSQRSIVPTISDPIPFTELLQKSKEYNQTFLCHSTGYPLARTYTDSTSALIIVGPEGDFTPAEIDAAKEAGCVLVSLGPTILRTETAGIAAVAQLIGLRQAHAPPGKGL